MCCVIVEAGIHHIAAEGSRTVLPTLGWGKQSTWLAASDSLAPLRAWPAPTFAQKPSGVLKHRTAEQESTPVTAVWALCAGLRAGV